jgi:hypothetical protein
MANPALSTGRVAVIACLSAGFAGCAPMTPYNPDRLPPAQMGRITEICRTVMGLPAGVNTHRQACEESLSHSFAAMEQADRRARNAPPPTPPVGSYFSASNDEIHRRERQACAAIGEDPSTSAFAQCVADLAGNLFDADNPIWRD